MAHLREEERKFDWETFTNNEENAENAESKATI
jgi:hypothetical protein